MTEDLAAHMAHESVTMPQDELDAHRRDCSICVAATNQRDLCAKGAELHDAVVRASQEAYRTAHPEAFAPKPHPLATGGPVNPGQVYLVGENGPEQIVESEPHDG